MQPGYPEDWCYEPNLVAEDANGIYTLESIGRCSYAIPGFPDVQIGVTIGDVTIGTINIEIKEPGSGNYYATAYEYWGDVQRGATYQNKQECGQNYCANPLMSGTGTVTIY